MEGNGGVCEKYSWSQTLQEVTVVIYVPSGTKGRNCCVKFGSESLSVTVSGETYIEGKLSQVVLPSDSTWTLDTERGTDQKVLTLFLCKRDKMQWWKNVIVGDEEIDITKLQPENSRLDDLDAETRQSVEKMMFDQRQKAAGKPTSAEARKHEALQKFMAQHPEMDFSDVKLM